MDYNELKLIVLQILRDNEPLDAKGVAGFLASSKGLSMNIHAVRMALMRYHKQGIMKRTRSGGSFKYTLSERGIGRLRWLESVRSRKL